MTPPLARSIRSLAIVAALAAPLAPARALVGAAPDSRFADRVAMVLIRGGDSAGFCSALVLGPRILLTAAHCLRPLRDLAVHYRDAAGAAVIIPVDAAIAHPRYRADAIQARVESIVSDAAPSRGHLLIAMTVMRRRSHERSFQVSPGRVPRRERTPDASIAS